MAVATRTDAKFASTREVNFTTMETADRVQTAVATISTGISARLRAAQFYEIIEFRNCCRHQFD
ncbi:hypothetical protein BOX15_Mlig019325g1 [Macrostomum lignano]|nr:hypothetical protein BOX15_Mlig019325g1 [Macrostomum lignano]